VKRTRLPARFVLFDWDGTLLNSFAADTRAYLAMFAGLGVEWTEKDLARHYHPDWYRVYRAARVHRSRWDEANRLWREAYARENLQLLPGARAALRLLQKRFTLGLVTSGDGTRVRRQLTEFRLASAFSACVCSEDAPHRKPHPAPLLKAMGILHAEPGECVYVGDSPQDMEMARRAGVRAIGIFGPFPTERGLRLARPELLLNSVKELPRYLTTIPAKAGPATNVAKAAARRKRGAPGRAQRRRGA
jgi:HAD superfamily hydrolase (TIGR01509 family)